MPKAARRRGPQRLLYPRGLVTTLMLVAGLGAVLLVVAEFVTLYSVHVAGRSAAVQTIQGGSNNSYAMIPIALVGVILALAATGGGGRLALAALGLVGLVALLIGLVEDLPSAQHSGLIHTAGRYLNGVASPSTGMYMETLGAVLLIIAAGLGLLFGDPAAAGAERPAET